MIINGSYNSVNSSLVSHDDQPQPQQPKDEKRHPIWKLSMFSYNTGLFHLENLEFTSTKGLILTFIFGLIMSAIFLQNIFSYGTVKNISTTKWGNQVQIVDNMTAYILPEEYNNTKLPSGVFGVPAGYPFYGCYHENVPVKFYLSMHLEVDDEDYEC